ncbi:MAG: radical SAM family heme chaperone HemW [Atopobiaceae bacterium]|nr:radical SAM family heme chaperone HemW [Atopobiaceae bacterium]
MDSGGVCGSPATLWQARLHADSAQALYVHVPFCVRKCAYCDFSSWATARDDSLMDRYVRSLVDRIGEAVHVGLLEKCETAYVGGGTPTMLGAACLGDLAASLRAAAPGISELTCEANPDSLSDEVLSALYDVNVTRLSIGVQSLQDEELEALGRLHDAHVARARVAAAVSMGFDVSVDLMCAVPLQTDESWRQTLGAAIGLGVGHVSVYPLQIEDGTELARMVGDDEPSWNAPEVQASRMDQAQHALEAAGFARYEVASYALPGKACQHNQSYWTARPYLGLGTGASSMLTSEDYDRLRSLSGSLPKLPDRAARVRLTMTSPRDDFARAAGFEGLSFDVECLDDAQAAAEDLMLGMRMTKGIGPGLVDHARQALGKKKVDDALASACKRGLATWRDGRFVPTHDGWLLGNELYGMLWDLADGEVRELST